MSKHTKEPWRAGRKGAVVADEPVPEISGSEDVAHYGGHLVAESVAPRNVRRIVACVNACAGLTTEFLETPGLAFTPAPLPQDIDGLVAAKIQRDQLLAALTFAVSEADAWGLDDDECEWLGVARAAIAAAESGK